VSLRCRCLQHRQHRQRRHKHPRSSCQTAWSASWCYAKDISTDTERHYLDPYGEGHFVLDKDGDPTWIDACGDEKYSKENDASIEVDKDGYVSNWVAPGYRNFCNFDKIEAVKGSETTKGAVTPAYSVHANCLSGWATRLSLLGLKIWSFK
jgi:hypothetical protein